MSIILAVVLTVLYVSVLAKSDVQFDEGVIGTCEYIFTQWFATIVLIVYWWHFLTLMWE